MGMKIDYAAHDGAYRRKIAAGSRGWDDDEAEYDYVSTLLQEAIPQSATSVLEVGCGMGNTLLRLSGRFTRRVGIDVSPTAIAYARERDAGGTYIQGDFLHYTDPERFDAVIDSKVLHCIHPRDRQDFIRKMATLLNPGGRIFGCHMYGLDGIAGYDPGTGILSSQGYFTRYAPRSMDTIIAEFKHCGLTLVVVANRTSPEHCSLEYWAEAPP